MSALLMTSASSGGGNDTTAATTTTTLQLCASCDRCRSRKTKCDGTRPCGNCVSRYRKVNKCENLEGIDLAGFDCVYSPAKRRGPIPGRSGHSRSAAAAAAANPHHQGGGANINTAANTNTYYAHPNAQQHNATAHTPPAVVSAGFANNNGGGYHTSLNDGMFSMGLTMEGISSAGGVGQQQHAAAMGGQQQQTAMMMNQAIMNTSGAGNNGNSSHTFSAEELKQMLALQQQLLVQQRQMQQQQQQQGMLQQLATGGSLQQGVNTTMTANSNNNAAAVGMAGMMGGVNSNYLNAAGMENMGGNSNGNNGGGFAMLNNTTNFQNQQQQAPAFQTQQQQAPVFQNQQQQAPIATAAPNHNHINQPDDIHRSAKRTHRVENVQSSSSPTLPDSVASHLPLLQLNNPNGAILRSYYELSTNDVLNLPPIPTEEEYCARLNVPSTHLPLYDRSALHAAQFSELALGALANNQIPLALELSNASVMCLRNCVGEPPGHGSCLYDVARAYLLHGIFRSFRGDMVRYFKYRRVCMTLILQMNNEPNVEALLAAISFHDAWAYLMHDAAEDSLPDIDESLPRLNSNNLDTINNNSSQIKANAVATNPINQMWMQGSPPVFLNNEASLVSRSLDAFACAVRSCCDQANHQFEDIAKASGMDVPSHYSLGPTPTTTAVMANEHELCSRNIVLSAKSLLDQHSGMSNGRVKRHGLYMIASAMSAFLENGEMEESGGGGSGGGSVGGFTNTQIKNLMSACDIIIQHPLLLHSPGPIYHMASNAAILLCHLLNGIHANYRAGAVAGAGGTSNSKVEGILFDEVLDTFMATRKALNIHRKNLPVKLRCHGIPRPSGVGPFDKKLDNNPEAPFIDMGETLMCLRRGCQNFVIMGCSPCVAVERSMKAARDNVSQQRIEDEIKDVEFERQLGEMDDISLDDDALLDVLSRIVQN